MVVDREGPGIEESACSRSMYPVAAWPSGGALGSSPCGPPCIDQTLEGLEGLVAIKLVMMPKATELWLRMETRLGWNWLWSWSQLMPKKPECRCWLIHLDHS